MTESAGRRRRRSPGKSGRLSHRTRPFVALGGIATIVLAATGVAIILGGGFGGPSPAPGTPAATSPGDLGLVTPAPSATPDISLRPIATASPSAEPRVGIRATQIRIDRLRIDLPIVEGDGIDAPLGKAAHYPGTAWPGGGSNIYLYAHARDGMFIALWEATPGDEVTLTLVDETERTYTVTDVLPKVPWDAIEYLDPTPAEQLTLQTCTSYGATAPRFIVIAVPKT